MANSFDPVCAFHGKRQSEHECLYCALCFENLTPADCWTDENGDKWDICVACHEYEQEQRLFQRLRDGT